MIYCTKCNNIYKGNNLKCPFCGYTNQNYKNIKKRSRDAIYYGYLYRVSYEEQLQLHSNIRTHYSLSSPNIIWEFLAMVVITGSTYDIVKSIAIKIYKEIKLKLFDKNKLKELIEDKNKLNTFIIYIKEYDENKMNTFKEVKENIKEEIIAEEISKAISKKGAMNLSHSDFKNASKKAMEKTKYINF